ncbi:hypothetical protein L6164_013172 [Bauhinia variegata]|uniref:Uncharacterized protein n=1 Tax=Bauhinia variegata TaxID=167791 RepID=A0ACB9PBI4_BAUVA|nr:hypothetical protein L6164_013172 [Bauhinia variegata]
MQAHRSTAASSHLSGVSTVSNLASLIPSLSLNPLPFSVTHAMNDPNWHHAMDLEFNALMANGTWELVPKSTYVLIGCKWVFPIKRNPDDTIDKYKARLMAKGSLCLVGSLQYLSITRLDISYDVNKLVQYKHSPKDTHMQALKQLLGYLKGTICHGLFLKCDGPLNVTGFSDAYSLAHASAEIIWILQRLCELGVPFKAPLVLHYDNTGTIYSSANLIYHFHMKHVELDYHFVREHVTNGTLQVHHISSKDQMADMLTKPLAK